jgi:very-short-patch-repair endonuclease
MTPEEKKLWYQFLKHLPITVNRQKNIGNYIVDFYIASKRLVIEIDGMQHGEPEAYEADRKRDSELFKLGISVVRYTNSDINKRFKTVCEDLLNRIGLKESDLKQLV